MITKVAQPPYWPKVLQGLRKITNLPPNVREIINAPQRLVFHQATPAGANPMAKAFVSTEDSDDDGNLDTVNMVVTNMEKEIPPDLLSQINQLTETDPAFQEIVSNIAKTLVHELAHIDDYDSEHGFPGGETIAESKEKSFNPIFASSTTNKNNDNDNIVKHNSKGELKMKQDLVKLANHLDNIGHRDLADRLDLVLKQAGLSDLMQGGLEWVDEKIVRNEGAGKYAQMKSEIKNMWWRRCTEAQGQSGAQRGSPLGLRADDCSPLNANHVKSMDGNMRQEWWSARNVSEIWDAAKAEGWVDDGFMEALGDRQSWDPMYGTGTFPEQEEPVSSPGAEGEVWDEADDFITATMSSTEKINKLAELMAGEFNSGVPGSFYRR